MGYQNLKELGVDCPRLNDIDLMLLCDQLNNEVTYLRKMRLLRLADAQALVAEAHDLLATDIVGRTTIYTLPTGQSITCDKYGFEAETYEWSESFDRLDLAWGWASNPW